MKPGRSVPLLVLVLGVAVAAAQAPDERCNGMVLHDVAREAGITFRHLKGGIGEMQLPETMGAGAAWFDFDNDGRLDLYLVQSGPFPPDGSASAGNRLYRNLDGRTFEDVSTDSGASDTGYGQGVTAADYDGDGRVDLYVCNYGRDTLLRNQGNGLFEDVTAAAGLGLGGWSSSAAFADADGDGDLDLYVTRYMVYDHADVPFCGDEVSGQRKYCDPSIFAGESDRFYLNQGDGTFVDATIESGFGEAGGKGLGVLFTDLDGDRLPDIYVSNDLNINFLYHNLGAGKFEFMSLLSGAGLSKDGKAESGMGVAVGDIDGDLDPDLMVTNFDVETNTVYINQGQMMFDDVSAESGFGEPSFNRLGFGIVLDDLNRDGFLDAYIANGHIYEYSRRETVQYAQPDLLLLGEGHGRFGAHVCGDIFETKLVGRALAAGDYDNDGDLDLALMNSGGPFQLIRNDGSEGDWLGVILEYVAPNLQGVGARVELDLGERSLVRWVTAGDSYQSTRDPRVLFGVQTGMEPVRLSVIWPDGTSEVLERPEPGSYYLARYQAGIAKSVVPEPGSEVEPVAGGRPFGILAGAAALAVLLLVLFLRRFLAARR